MDAPIISHRLCGSGLHPAASPGAPLARRGPPRVGGGARGVEGVSAAPRDRFTPLAGPILTVLGSPTRRSSVRASRRRPSRPIFAKGRDLLADPDPMRGWMPGGQSTRSLVEPNRGPPGPEVPLNADEEQLLLSGQRAADSSSGRLGARRIRTGHRAGRPRRAGPDREGSALDR